MKKRTRITALITTLCICISLFVVGVLAATTASLSVTSTLKFSADGVYVMVDASLKQGADVETAQVLSGEGAPTGQPTYKAYSYPRMATGTTPDAPNGEPSTKHFVDSTGAQASTWAIGDITYTSENVVVVYEFLVSNYSEFEVTGTVEGISEALASYTDQLSITTYTGTASSDATATSSPTYTFNIPARTSETTPGQACYKIAVTLNKFTSNLVTDTITINVSFEETLQAISEYFTYSSDNTKITGLSDTYKNLETKPEILVIPSKAPDGTPITAIGEETSTTNVADIEFDIPSIYAPIPEPGTTAVMDGLNSEIIIIQNGIINIEGYAFYKCYTLTSITIPNSIISIGEYAFEYTNLSTITFEENSTLTSIGLCAFQNCNNLTSITIPSGVKDINHYAFNGCNLNNVEFADPNGWWYTSNANATSGTSFIEDLSDPAIAATCLKTTYSNYCWKKS
ncbi:MAG TPA: leucine-rich repeat domain-containing protein [Candidatus Caccopulliclostridium gallistercoris]|uniref:Leucine-rich repeat domain-containing protein n=1 Tax=Candidatus Caccopulliclostridium gallistercoris TaxID=2840719 RepID=A0A9D1NEM0_9FIRM|nr:leucine-rich repeat domain-containing protein [Candidatus Caccopulliclostridium gallistercoris]